MLAGQLSEFLFLSLYKRRHRRRLYQVGLGDKKEGESRFLMNTVGGFVNDCREKEKEKPTTVN